MRPPPRERFPFVERDPTIGSASLAPMLNVTLRRAGRTVAVCGLIDTGAAVNVLPWSVGLALGGIWNPQATLDLGGNLAGRQACSLLVEGFVGSFPPKRLIFAWSNSDHVPVLFGQVNFLQSFDVLLSRFGGWFELMEP